MRICKVEGLVKQYYLASNNECYLYLNNRMENENNNSKQ